MNPSAFPIVIETDKYVYDPGMTLRDYFAAKAMQGLMANDDWNLYQETSAIKAYEVADAMLSARGTEKAREQK